MCIYNIDHIYALRIENTRKVKQLEQLQRKPRKKIRGFNGIKLPYSWTLDARLYYMLTSNFCFQNTVFATTVTKSTFPLASYAAVISVAPSLSPHLVRRE